MSPWDILQIMIDRKYIQSANEENKVDSNADVEKVDSLPPDEVDKKLKEAEKKHKDEKRQKQDNTPDDPIEKKQKKETGIIKALTDKFSQNTGINLQIQALTTIMTTILTIIIGIGALFIYIY